MRNWTRDSVKARLVDLMSARRLSTTSSFLWALLMACAVSFVPQAATAQQAFTGEIGLEARGFAAEPRFELQSRHSVSVFFQPELFLDWANGDQRLVVSPFVRLDSEDKRRSHVDLREAYWQWFGRTLEVRAGFVKVFWGVTESQHLVDIINQTDGIEAPDGEAKLGQPAFQATWITDYGTFDSFVMPFFRERSFPGKEGRLRAPFVLDYDEKLHSNRVDLALRYAHYVGSVDFGLSAFHGTSRDPQYQADQESGVVSTTYPTITQIGLDAQLTKGDLLAKLEAIYRSGYGKDFLAAVGGIEYTFANVRNSGLDLGLLAELHLDGRDSILLGEQSFNTTPFENDLFAGLRFSFNDVQSTAILAGTVVDTKTGESAFFLESNRRIGDRFVASIEARAFSRTDSSSPLSFFRSDDYAQFSLSYFF